MNRHALILATLLALTPLLTAPAAAGGYQAGHGFQTGGVYFHVVSVSPEGAALFRASEGLRADGLEEHPGCYRVGRAFYHQESCPVLQAHFARHGSVADSAPAPAAAVGSGGTGSHPIDYLRGSYVEPDRASYSSYGGFFYGAWLATGANRGAHRSRPGLGFRGARGTSGHGFAGGYVGTPSFGFTFRRW